jgi:hypothetical protein
MPLLVIWVSGPPRATAQTHRSAVCRGDYSESGITGVAAVPPGIEGFIDGAQRDVVVDFAGCARPAAALKVALENTVGGVVELAEQWAAAVALPGADVGLDVNALKGVLCIVVIIQDSSASRSHQVAGARA